MHFQWLSLLKNVKGFSEEEIVIFDFLFYKIYQKGYYKRFSPRIYKYFDIAINEDSWIKALNTLSQHSLVIKHFELCHPVEGHTLQTFSLITDIPIGDCIYVEELDEEVYVSENNIDITYSLPEGIKPTEIEGKSKLPKKYQEGAKKLPPENIDKYKLVEHARNLPDGFINECIKAKQEQLLDKFSIVRDNNYPNKTTKAKGDALEDLCQELFHSPPLLSFHKRNEKTSMAEYDLIFRVSQYQETLFGKFSDLLPIECKNWEEKADAKVVRNFHEKMRSLASEVGILCSKKGLTGDPDFRRDGKMCLRSIWDSDRDVIIILDLLDITKVITNKCSLYSLLQNKYDEIRLI